MNIEISDPPPASPVSQPSAAAAASELNALRQDLAGQKDLHLRLAADFENFKRRSRLESETRASAQKESFIVELLPVIDNLERALAVGGASELTPFYQGVAMTLQQLQQLLRQQGVASAEITGQPFDPHQHEALSQGCDPAQPDRAILQVIQRGYRKGTKVLRPAKIIVNNLTAAEPAHHGR